MGDAGGGFFRFPASLDPQAQEFRPRDHRHVITPHHHAVIPSLPQPFYYHPPPPPPLPFVGGGGVIGYQQDPFLNHGNYDRPVSRGGFNRLSPPPAVAPTPTRAILVCSLPVDGRVSETLVRRELEVFGPVRGVQMERIRDGIVTVHFYDLRHAEAAMDAFRHHHHHHMHNINNIRRPFSGWSTVWAQFTIPAINAMPEGQNQGTIVVFNLDPTASSSFLRHIFQSYGAVKEIRETPMKRQQRFIEFHDVRDAARALNDMNGKEILGKPVVIEFSRPGGFNKKLSLSSSFINSSSSSKFIPLPPPVRRFHTSPSPPPPPPPPLLAPRHILQRNLSNEGKKGTKLNLNANNNKQWKGGKSYCRYDSKFLINDDEPIKESSSSSSNTDLRTTVMIKNIPNKYSQKLLLNMLDNHCIHCNEQITEESKQQPFSSYDFLYLPIDFNNKCNVGYGFVNMTSPEGARRLHKAFNKQHWEVFNSKKICEVTYARVQGLEALKEHFKNSKFPSEMDHYLPVVFSPPRDGSRLTEPVAIVCLKQQQSDELDELDHEGEEVVNGVLEDGDELEREGSVFGDGGGGGGGGRDGISDSDSDSS
ncbi:Protein terminal ear1, partial [Linum grandiflorum]